jgi:hypothetical protein
LVNVIVDGVLEAVFVPRGEIRKWRGARNARGKQMYMGKSELDTKRFTPSLAKVLRKKGMSA